MCVVLWLFCWSRKKAVQNLNPEHPSEPDHCWWWRDQGFLGEVQPTHRWKSLEGSSDDQRPPSALSAAVAVMAGSSRYSNLPWEPQDINFWIVEVEWMKSPVLRFCFCVWLVEHIMDIHKARTSLQTSFAFRLKSSKERWDTDVAAALGLFGRDHKPLTERKFTTMKQKR